MSGLLVLMYHRAQAGRFGNAPEMLDAHFAHLSHSCANVLPGEPLRRYMLNVCLSFDDGYFDFYTTVFPLLQKHNLRALLAIPPAVVKESVDAAYADRLAVTTEQAFDDPGRGAFCTWPELRTMAASGHVTIAAHGLTHRRLDRPDAALPVEIDQPRAILTAQLRQTVDSFVFPFGRFSARALEQARLAYSHVFRIGGALNCDVRAPLLYRVNADAMETPTSLFSPGRLALYRARYWWNRLRGR